MVFEKHNKCEEKCEPGILGDDCEPRSTLSAALCNSFVKENYDRYSRIPDIKMYYNRVKEVHRKLNQTTLLRVILYIISISTLILFIIVPISTTIKIIMRGKWDVLFKFILIGIFTLVVVFMQHKFDLT